MDKIAKALVQLTEKEWKAVADILKKISVGNVSGSDVKKLKGRDDIFRIRKGDIRIVYRVVEGKIFLLLIERRSEKTYRGLQ